MIVVVVVILLISGGVALRIHHQNADRMSCALNIRNIQTAMRSYTSMSTSPYYDIGDPLDKSWLFEKMHSSYVPTCPSGGTYIYMDKVPKIGVLYCTCSHAKTKGHEPEDYSDW